MDLALWIGWDIWKYVGGVRYRASNGANNISIAVWQKVKGRTDDCSFSDWNMGVGSQLRICCPLIKMAKAQFCKSL